MKVFFTVIDRILMFLCVLFIAVIVIFVLLQVFSRYVLQLPIQGIEELARLMFVWACFCGAALACLRQENITVTFLIDKIPPAARKWIKLLLSLLIAAMSAIMTVRGTGYVIEKWMYPDYSTALLYPRSLFWVPVPFAGFIMLLKSLHLIIERFILIVKAGK